MSLSLLQSYSSAEEEDDERVQFQNSSDEDEEDEAEAPGVVNNYNNSMSVFDLAQQQQPPGSALPSALDAFSEITGPPRFLNNSVVEEEQVFPEHVDRRRRRNRKDKKNRKDLPAGVVVEANAQLVGMHERVRSDVEGSKAAAAVVVQSHQKKEEAEKKKGSTVKEKEKSKRMRGQSSHATWKSETEMQLRQTFD